MIEPSDRLSESVNPFALDHGMGGCRPQGVPQALFPDTHLNSSRLRESSLPTDSPVWGPECSFPRPSRRKPDVLSNLGQILLSIKIENFISPPSLCYPQVVLWCIMCAGF